MGIPYGILAPAPNTCPALNLGVFNGSLPGVPPLLNRKAPSGLRACQARTSGGRNSGREAASLSLDKKFLFMVRHVLPHPQGRGVLGSCRAGVRLDLPIHLGRRQAGYGVEWGWGISSSVVPGQALKPDSLEELKVLSGQRHWPRLAESWLVSPGGV